MLKISFTGQSECALETLIDHLHPEAHPEIGAAKDMAAGAALVASVIAIVVGVAFLFSWLGALECSNPVLALALDAQILCYSRPALILLR